MNPKRKITQEQWYVSIRGNRKSILFIAITSLFTLSLLFSARHLEGFASWYAATIYPFYPETLGRFFSLFPISLFEVLILAIILLLTSMLLRGIWLISRRNVTSKPQVKRAVRNLFIALSSLLLCFTLTASINYSRTAFANSAGYVISDSTVEELIHLNLLLIDDLKQLDLRINTDENGTLSLNGTDVSSEAVIAMKKLGEQYPELAGYYPTPKPVMLSEIMSYLGITGIFSPFTIEANYNRDVPAYLIPYTIAHELAHAKGYMKEEEAGFIAYLACRDSSSNTLQYSAAVNGLMYSLNALHANASQEEFQKVFDQIPHQVKTEMQLSSAYWEVHTIRLTNIAKAANDRYLMANAQTAGTKSYGLMVDLLLAEYAQETGGNTLL